MPWAGHILPLSLSFHFYEMGTIKCMPPLAAGKILEAQVSCGQHAVGDGGCDICHLLVPVSDNC